MGCATCAFFIFYCYWPLTRYFFSQDDFYFLEKASSGFRASVDQFFNTRPGQFRPLTKGLYFLVMWPLFGLNPVPYHVVSLVLHAVNTILSGVVLRRLGVSRTMSWIAALLFAANVSHLEAVAWISCVQELMGATFAFLALIWGIDAMRGKSRMAVIAAPVAYLLALCSYEQTVAVPLVLIALRWSRWGWRSALRACARPLLPMLVLLGAYSAYMLILRGLPQGGPYEMGIGSNVLANLSQYAGSVFAIWLIYPYVDLPLGLRGSHVIWLALIAWFLVRRMRWQLAFGCAAFLLFLAPVLFIQHHVFSFHLYLPAIGAWFLIATAADSVVEMLAASWRRNARLALACTVVLAGLGSTSAVRKNMTNYCSAEVKIPQLRVLRRAVLAEKVCSDVSRRWNGGSRLSLVYGGRQDLGNWTNIQSAISDGSALRLVLRQPTLAVTLTLPGETADIPTNEMMIVTELGETFTYSQYQTIVARYQPTP